jgi:hypothetical protein
MALSLTSLYGTRRKEVLATPEGFQMLSPPTEPLTVQVPGARNLIHWPSTLQVAGVFEVMTGGIVNPRVTDFDEAEK